MTPAAGVVAEADSPSTVDLQYRYDDAADPETVTIYDATAEDITTTWISAAVEDAVELDSLE